MNKTRSSLLIVILFLLQTLVAVWSYADSKQFRTRGLEADTCVNCTRDRNDSTLAPVPLSQPSFILAPVDWQDNRMHPYSKAAYRLLNTVYQRCDAADGLLNFSFDDNDPTSFHGLEGLREPEDEDSSKHSPNEYVFNRAELVKSHPYLAERYSPQCRDMRMTPPIFHLGGKSILRREGNGYAVSLFNEKINGSNGQYVTSDCSNFLSMVCAISGMKFRPKNELAQACVVSTQDLLVLSQPGRKNQGSCLRVVDFSEYSSVLPGDIVVFRNQKSGPGHTMLIDAVGDDPFGLAKMKSEEDCRMRYGEKEMAFTISQAGSHAGRLALTRHEAKSVVRNSSAISPILFEMGLMACYAKVEKQNRSAQLKPSLSYDDRQDLSQIRQAAILRHVGKENSDCVLPNDQTVKLVGEECLNSCENIHSKTAN